MYTSENAKTPKDFAQNLQQTRDLKFKMPTTKTNIASLIVNAMFMLVTMQRKTNKFIKKTQDSYIKSKKM